MNAEQFQQVIARMPLSREQMEEVTKLSAKMSDDERAAFTKDLQNVATEYTQAMNEVALPLSEMEKLVVGATSKTERAELSNA